mmetsp:Transcript_28756/g.59676  ORF Transcript_28756/g.59676 Transcript_28756/m.59676 type:complete len:929 (-) Transcript_28756:67-2853(-)
MTSTPMALSRIIGPSTRRLILTSRGLWNSTSSRQRPTGALSAMQRNFFIDAHVSPGGKFKEGTNHLSRLPRNNFRCSHSVLANNLQRAEFSTAYDFSYDASDDHDIVSSGPELLVGLAPVSFPNIERNETVRISDDLRLLSRKPCDLSPNDDMNGNRKKSNKIDGGGRNSIPKQNIHSANILFDKIAPHLEVRSMKQLMKKLEPIISRGLNPHLDSKSKGGRKRSLKRRLHLLFEGEKSKSKAKRKDDYTWSIKNHTWLEPILQNYFLGELIDGASLAGSSRDYKRDPTYPPNRNRNDYEKNLKTLAKAREVALNHPIFWSEKSMRQHGYRNQHLVDIVQRERQRLKYSKKIKDKHVKKDALQLQSETVGLMELLVDKLPPPHFDKIMSTLEQFSTLDSGFDKSDESPGSVVDGEGGNGNEFGFASNSSSSCNANDDEGGFNHDTSMSTRGKKKTKPLPLVKENNLGDWKKNKISTLGKMLTSLSSSHSHLVAVELGLFLYVDVPRGEKSHSNDGLDDEIVETPCDVSNAEFAIKTHKKLHSSEKRFQKTQDEFVSKMMELQHTFVSWNDATSGSDGDNIDRGESDEDMTADLSDGELQREQSRYNTESKKLQQDSIAETLLELKRMGLRNKDYKLEIKKGRPKKGVHLRFTAIRIDEGNDAAYESENENQLDQHLVFVNNLPIDVTEEEIYDIYSRCGPLESVQLFNLRPDLDPGRLSKKQMKNRRRKHIMNGASSASAVDNYAQQRNTRPRTPVYGMITFKTAKGYKLATSPEMSIFGCVIRRHPVMSIKPQKLTTLYVENIPPNLFSMEVEYKLAKFLQPHHIHVSLDGMRGVGRGFDERRYYFANGINAKEKYQEFSEPASCELKFEDFNTAMAAYQLIKEEGANDEEENANGNIVDFLGNGCQLHWFRTPADGMQFWTRERTF